MTVVLVEEVEVGIVVVFDRDDNGYWERGASVGVGGLSGIFKYES